MAFRIEPATHDFGNLPPGSSTEVDALFLDVPPDVTSQFTATFQLGDLPATFTGTVTIDNPDVVEGEIVVPPEFEQNGVSLEIVDLTNVAVTFRLTRA